MHHHRADQREATAHLDLGVLLRHALALGQPVVLHPVVAVARVVLGVGHLEVDARPDPQPELLDAPLDDLRPADEDRLGDALVDDHLRGAQHALVLALRVDDPLRRLLGRLEDRLHQQSRVVDELRQPLAVRREIVDGLRGDPRVHRRLRHRRRDGHDQPRVERLRDQVLGAEAQVLHVVSLRDDVRLLGHCQVRKRTHRSHLHRLVDARCRHVERAAEDEREHQHVVDLVRIVGPPGRDDRVGPRRLREVGHDLGLRVGERHDQRPVGHLRQPLGLEHPRRRQAEEDVGAGEDVVERARVGGLRVARLVVVHLLGAPGVDDALDVRHPDVLLRDAQRHQQVEAGKRRRAGARADELDVGGILADHAQAIQDCRADDDRGAVLVVVEHGDLHPLAQLALDVEALRRLDVLEVDAAERGFHRGDDLDQLVRVALVDLDVEAVDAGELLEQHRLALHHRLGRQRTDRPQPQHRRAVGHDADQVAARGQRARLGGVADDLVAGRGHARGIGERQVALIGELLGRRDRDLARRGLAVVFERRGANIRVRHGVFPWRKGVDRRS